MTHAQTNTAIATKLRRGDVVKIASECVVQEVNDDHALIRDSEAGAHYMSLKNLTLVRKAGEKG